MNIFLDDERDPKTSVQVDEGYHQADWAVVRNPKEFQSLIQDLAARNLIDSITTISFDNDLGANPEGGLYDDGFTCLKWVYEYYPEIINDAQILVHSANPVRARQMREWVEELKFGGRHHEAFLEYIQVVKSQRMEELTERKREGDLDSVFRHVEAKNL